MIKIMADSTCDLRDDILEKYDISVAPLKITIDNKTFEDRITITADDLFRNLPLYKSNPTTAMPSPVVYRAIIDEHIEKGYNEFLCICMSSGTSGSYQSATLAKNDFYEDNPDSKIKIHIVDSKSMSHGSGYLILKSALLKEKGSTFQELIDFNETYKTHVKHFLAVDDLDNLIRSGRLSNVSAMIGKVLRIKPIMSMRDGKGAITAKVRSNKKVKDYYVKEFMKRNNEELTDFIIIGYTSDKITAEVLKAQLIESTDFKGDIYIMQMGVAVGVHVGLGGLSMFFIEKR